MMLVVGAVGAVGVRKMSSVPCLGLGLDLDLGLSEECVHF